MSEVKREKLPMELIKRLADGCNPAYDENGKDLSYDYEELIASMAQHVLELSAKLEIVNTLMDAATELNNLAKENTEKLVAENMRMDAFVDECLKAVWEGGSLDGGEIQDIGLKHGLLREEEYSSDQHESLVEDPGNFDDGDKVYFRTETPNTDAAIAEIKAQGRIEGAHFVANRMLAAWEAGFIEDTAKNAADIARMILISTEFMAHAPDGDFDRSFADGVLEDIATDLRAGRKG